MQLYTLIEAIGKVQAGVRTSIQQINTWLHTHTCVAEYWVTPRGSSSWRLLTHTRYGIHGMELILNINQFFREPMWYATWFDCDYT
jgi:hypothetical protein